MALLGACLLTLTVVVTQARQFTSETIDPGQTQDPAFAQAYKEWTGEARYGSPLVDHLPLVKGVPTPRDVLGYYIGAPGKLTYYADILKSYRALAAATPRVKVETIGRSDEGRELVVVWVTSEQNMKGLQANRDRLAKLADPRGVSDADVRQLLAVTKPHYHVIGGLHSSESGPSEMLMELVYRLATETSPLITAIRNNVYVSVTPVADTDGRDRYVDSFYQGLEAAAAAPPVAAASDARPAGAESRAADAGTPADQRGGQRGRCRRAASRSARRHADGRSLLGQIRLPRQQPRHQPGADRGSRAHRLVLHGAPDDHARPARVDDPDVHVQRWPASEPESRPAAVRRTAVVFQLGTRADDQVGHARGVHARVHGRLVAGLLRVGRLQSQRADEDVRDAVGTRPGGVHRATRRLGALQRARRIERHPRRQQPRRRTAGSPASDARTLPTNVRPGADTAAQAPRGATPERRARGGTSGDAPQSGTPGDAPRGGAPGEGQRAGGRGGVPALPTGRGGAQDREWYRGLPVPANAVASFTRRDNTNYMETGVLSSLQLTAQFPSTLVENFYVKTRNALEEGRTKAPFGFVIPVQRDMTRVAELLSVLRLQRIEIGRATAAFKVDGAAYPAGSYVIKRDQPYGRLAKNLLEKQVYPDTRLTTYDDSGWTMGLLMGVDVKEIGDAAVLKVAVAPVTTVLVQGKVVDGGSAGFAVAHYGSLNMIAFRYRLRATPMKIAEKAFTSGGIDFPAGSFVVAGAPSAELRAAVEQLGLTAASLPALPTVPMHDAPAPRIAIYSQWTSTQDLGWYRLAFDRIGIPYDLIYKEQVARGDLRARYDVILMAAQNITRQTVFQAAAARPQPYEKTDRYKFLGMYGSTPDMSGGFGQAGVDAVAKFLEGGGTLVTAGAADRFPIEFGWAHTVDTEPITGVTAQRPIVQAEIVKTDDPVFYGYTDKTIPINTTPGSRCASASPTSRTCSRVTWEETPPS